MKTGTLSLPKSMIGVPRFGRQTRPWTPGRRVVPTPYSEFVVVPPGKRTQILPTLGNQPKPSQPVNNSPALAQPKTKSNLYGMAHATSAREQTREFMVLTLMTAAAISAIGSAFLGSEPITPSRSELAIERPAIRQSFSNYSNSPLLRTLLSPQPEDLPSTPQRTRGPG
jgi:hypothetical protein